jgi:predicted SnoaL-like aldol condensation-catalyzing enzyme
MTSRAPASGVAVPGKPVSVTIAQNQEALLASFDPQLAANKRLVFDWWREVLAAAHVEVAEKYMHTDYIQHNPNIATGREGFVQFFSTRLRQDISPTIANLVTIVAEGDLVVFSFRRELPDPQDPTKNYTSTWFDMMRVKDGKIAEHWDYGTK